MTISVFKLSLTTIIVAFASTWAVHDHVQQRRLRETARLREENDELRWKISRQHDASSQPHVVRERSSAADGLPNPAPTDAARLTISAAETARVSGTEYRNEGQATPIAALQTFAWACDQGDTAILARLIWFDEGARHKAVAYMLTLPAEVRKQWSSPEAMAAPLLSEEVIEDPYPGASILPLAKIEVISEGRVALLLPDANRERTEFQKTPEGWKYAITEKRVDDYIAQRSEAKGAAVK